MMGEIVIKTKDKRECEIEKRKIRKNEIKKGKIRI